MVVRVVVVLAVTGHVSGSGVVPGAATVPVYVPIGIVFVELVPFPIVTVVCAFATHAANSTKSSIKKMDNFFILFNLMIFKCLNDFELVFYVKISFQR